MGFLFIGRSIIGNTSFGLSRQGIRNAGGLTDSARKGLVNNALAGIVTTIDNQCWREDTGFSPSPDGHARDPSSDPAQLRIVNKRVISDGCLAGLIPPGGDLMVCHFKCSVVVDGAQVMTRSKRIQKAE